MTRWLKRHDWLVAVLALAALAGIPYLEGSRPCSTDTDCGCTLDCLESE